MTNSSDLFRREATLIRRVFYRDPVQDMTVTVEAGATFCRATALGCGGQGAVWGGGGALARRRFPISDGEALTLRVGNTSTASVFGDSYVKRQDGTVLVYADRGRGNGTRGLASNSIGDVRLDGSDGNSSAGRGGAPASDEGLYGPVVGTGYGYRASGFYSGALQADPGGGGLLSYVFNNSGEIERTIAYPAGAGLVVLEYFNFDPGY